MAELRRVGGVCIRSASSDTCVIFVHGILSDGEQCWMNDDGTAWPNLLVAEPSLQSIGIYSFSYRSDVLSQTYSISDVVDSIREFFNLDRLWTMSRIFFVCHSMGGIAVRRFIVVNQAKLIESSTKLGLFLVSSPALGSKDATTLYILARLIRNTQAEALRFSQQNTWLNDLDKEFLTLKESKKLSIDGKEIVEDEPIKIKKWFGLKRQIVEPFSAARYFGESYKVPYSDHFSIAKPFDRNAIQHRLLLRFITISIGALDVNLDSEIARGGGDAQTKSAAGEANAHPNRAGITQDISSEIRPDKFNDFDSNGEILNEQVDRGFKDQAGKVAKNEDLAVFLGTLERMSTENAIVVGHYFRFEEKSRVFLKYWVDLINQGLMTKTTMRKNFLIWGAPGSGKTFFVNEMAKALGPKIIFYELNGVLGEMNDLESRLSEMSNNSKPALVLLDEIDSLGEWYDRIFPLLDINTGARRHVVFILAGSQSGGFEKMIDTMRRKKKGADLLDRIPGSNRFEIPALSIEDQIGVFVAAVVRMAHQKGRKIVEIEKFVLFFVLNRESLRSPRHIENLVALTISRMPISETRLRYCHLFDRTDPECAAFKARYLDIAQTLQDTSIQIR